MFSNPRQDVSTETPAEIIDSTHSTTPTSTTADRASVPTLRRLYLVRFAFAVAWAGLLASTASSLGPFATALLIIYPAFDVAAAVVDGRSSARAGAWPAALGVNIAVSTVAAVGLAVAAAADISTVVQVWGAWAIVSGIVQVVVGRSRRSLSGQWPMMLSGTISVVAGGSFILTAADADSMSQVAGYAVLGGIFFLVSALRLGRVSRAMAPTSKRR